MLQSGDLRDFYSPKTSRVMKSRRMKWAVM